MGRLQATASRKYADAEFHLHLGGVSSSFESFRASNDHAPSPSTIKDDDRHGEMGASIAHHEPEVLAGSDVQEPWWWRSRLR